MGESPDFFHENVPSGLRETFQLLDDPEFNQLGRQTWVLILIVITELLICIKVTLAFN